MTSRPAAPLPVSADHAGGECLGEDGNSEDIHLEHGFDVLRSEPK